MKQTLFVRRPVINAAAIVAWAKLQGFETTLPAEDMHVTIAFSKTPVEWDQIGPTLDALMSTGGERSVEPLGDQGAVVLKFSSPLLQQRWAELCRAGAVWDYPTYQPHVTISYNADSVDLSKVQPFTDAIILGPEVHEPVKAKWFDTVTEKTMTTNGAVTQEQVLKYLRANAPDIAAIVEKLDVGDVHKPNAGSGDPKKKPGAQDDGDKKDGFPNLVAQAQAKLGKGLNLRPGDDDEVSWLAKIEVEKVDPDQMMMFGWASVCQIDGVDVVDKQDDLIAVEEIEKGAYDFVLYSRQHGDMHQQVGTGRLVESCVFTQEKATKGLIALDPENGQQIFGWWTGFKIDEPKLWEAHKRGERPELSIGGRGTRVPV